MATDKKLQCVVVTPEKAIFDEPAEMVILPMIDGELGVQPGHSALVGKLGKGELRLKLAIERIKDRYTHIIIDCPPSLNMLTVNALVAAEAVIVPTQCEYYALEGISALVETVEKIRKILNPVLHIEGFLRTMYDPRNNLANQVSQQLIKHFGDKVYRTIIPRNVRLAEAPSHGLPALLYDKSSAGALAYLALAGEMLRRDDAQRAAAGN